MSLIRLGLALLLLLATVSQLLQPVQGRRKMCGEALIQALDVICVNGFTRRVRRSSGKFGYYAYSIGFHTSNFFSTSV